MSDQDNWNLALQTEARRQRVEFDQFRAEWDKWTTFSGLRIPLGHGWRQSLKSMQGQGLTLDDMLELIPVAMNAVGVKADDRWRYFCGCAWNRVRQIRADAMDLLREWEAQDFTPQV